jgi:hypothetical protein
LTHKKIPKNRSLYSAAIQNEVFAFLQTVFLFFAACEAFRIRGNSADKKAPRPEVTATGQNASSVDLTFIV